MILLLTSFIGGILTVLAPCILPLLPVIIGGSISGDHSQGFNKKKAFTIIISLGLSVIIFTLLLKASTLLIDIPEYVWKWISGGIVLLLGIVTLFPSLWENQFLAKLSGKSNVILGQGYKKKSFWGDVIIGSALGPVFSTCSPTYFIVLATVLPVNPFIGMLYLLSYTVGLCLSLLLVSIAGQKIVNKLGIAADPRGWFKKTLGILFIVVGIAVIGGFDKKTQLFLLDSGFFDVTKIEQRLLQLKTTPITSAIPINETKNTVIEPVSTTIVTSGTKLTEPAVPTFLSALEKKFKYKLAPELVSPNGFVNINGVPVTIASLKGKVVLLDIWTYSCINCQRTLPYVNDWYKKYKDMGFEIIGIHTPEFAFEKIQTNVEKAVVGFGIKYPVVLDNNYLTWNALGNQYWPRKYLIDVDGYIVYDHIGEGGYEDTEKAIQEALKERNARTGVKEITSSSISKPSNVILVDSSKVKSPEIYFGSARNQNLVNGNQGISGEQVLSIPSKIESNGLYLGGIWNVTSEFAENKNVSDIIFNYEAKNVYFAAGSDKGVEVEIYKDGELVKKITIKDEKLYSLIEDTEYGKHTLRIKIPISGLKAFTFTFG